MKTAAALLAVLAISTLPGTTVAATPLSVELVPSPRDPPAPRMGDHLEFHTTIRNTGGQPIDGLIAWISLVQVDPGKERPVDLEDWSAQKAVALPSLSPGQALETDWPMRLIQAGHYRVVVSAVSRHGANLTPSRFADFTVRSRPVVESRRVLPVALAIPSLIAATLVVRRRRSGPP